MSHKTPGFEREPSQHLPSHSQLDNFLAFAFENDRSQTLYRKLILNLQLTSKKEAQMLAGRFAVELEESLPECLGTKPSLILTNLAKVLLHVQTSEPSGLTSDSFEEVHLKKCDKLTFKYWVKLRPGTREFLTELKK